MNQKKSTYIEKVTSVTKADEIERMFGGVLSNTDFSTTSPNENRIEKIYTGIENYLHYKRYGDSCEDNIEDDTEIVSKECD